MYTLYWVNFEGYIYVYFIYVQKDKEDRGTLEDREKEISSQTSLEEVRGNCENIRDDLKRAKKQYSLLLFFLVFDIASSCKYFNTNGQEGSHHEAEVAEIRIQEGTSFLVPGREAESRGLLLSMQNKRLFVIYNVHILFFFTYSEFYRFGQSIFKRN